jgi:hypothetical protein
MSTTAKMHHEAGTSGQRDGHAGYSSIGLMGYFLVGQAIIMFIYNAWKNRQVEKSKKFI